jgi:hypothetical protein
MHNYKYTLEKYAGQASKHTCPNCNKPRVFTRYIDTETKSHLSDLVGRCDREIECGYHYKPSEFFRDNPLDCNNARTTQFRAQSSAQSRTQIVRTPSYIAPEYLEMSIDPRLQNENNLVKYLKTVLGTVTDRFVKRFNIGTAKRWPGATVFWYVDRLGKIRSGKIIQYNPATGKRVKEPFPHITWVHAELLKKGLIKEFYLDQCFFGEHQLLIEPHKPIGIVESEKSAIIASAYLPELTWMACGSLSGLSAKRLSAISQNTIILYPDIKGYDNWERKAHELRTNGFRITVSTLLEKHSSITHEDRKEGLDLADFLPRLPLPLSNLERMEARNPIVKDLVNRFNLVEIGNRAVLSNDDKQLSSK